MDNHFTIEPTSTMCLNLNMIAQQYCLPRREICFPKNLDGLLTESDYCEEECENHGEFLLQVQSDKCLCIQTQFFDPINTPRQNPTTNWVKVCILDDSGEKEYTPEEITKSFGLGWGGQHSIQNWCLDFSKIQALGHTCFVVLFKSGDLTCKTRKIIIEDNCKCKWASFESTYGNNDCLGNSYEEVNVIFGDDSSKVYSNEICLPFDICEYGGEVNERIYINNTLTRTANRDYFRLFPCAAMPMYVIRILKQIFSGSDITINGERYEVDSLARISPSSKRRKRFSPEFEVYRECRTDLTC